jgi:hypothetical protein
VYPKVSRRVDNEIIIIIIIIITPPTTTTTTSLRSNTKGYAAK